MRSLLIFIVGVVLAFLINFVTDLFPISDDHPAARWWLLGAVLVTTMLGGALSWPRGDGSDPPGDPAIPSRQVIHNAHGPVVGEISGGTVTFHQNEPDIPETDRRP
jgi:hypothetical protein